MPAVVDTSASRDMRSGAAKATCNAMRPPERVAGQHKALGGMREHVLDTAGERDWTLGVDMLAMPGQVQRQRQIACRGQTVDHAVPGTMGAAKPVQQDDCLRHANIL